MMLTRCPACQTVFRLRPEQLHARRGEVRCGHCFHPFNALEHALELPTDGAPAAPPPAPGVLILEDKPAPTPARQSPASMLEFGIPEPEPAPQSEPAFTGQTYSAAWRAGQIPAPQTIAAAAADHPPQGAWTPPAAPVPSPLATPPSPSAPAASELAESTLPRVFPGVLRSGRRSAPLSAPAPADDAISAPDAELDFTPPPAPPEPERPSHDQAPDAASEALDAATDEPDLARLDATYGRPPRKTHPVLQAVGGMLVVALTALLGVQTAYLYRTEIARELPGLRPLLTEACARAGCTIPYPQDADRIAIEASDLQAEPGKPGRYLLHATLNNRAEYPQRWPHLELTLTDAGDTPISRRVLAPADWLSAAETAAAFPARNAVELRLPFEVAGLAPTGYRIYAFYP
jgi:predicted Zn finger-like uncharacterized protein